LCTSTLVLHPSRGRTAQTVLPPIIHVMDEAVVAPHYRGE
jgi:hypothetical protein